MRLDIQYRMRFIYDKPVWESQNELRVKPRSDDRQQVIARRVTTAPTSRILSFTDYWGTTVDHIGVREPHLAFEVVAEAAVETSHPPPITVDPHPRTLADAEFALPLAQYLSPSSHTAWDDRVVGIARDAVSGLDGVRQRVDAIVQATRRHLRYESGATDVGTPISSLLDGGAGVCQDFAHLTIAMLRPLGIPARYVSGYLFAADETNIGDADATDQVRVQTHAWVEVNVPGHGWWAVDPTNDVAVEDRHAVIGHGRDYDDVAPVRGVFVGDATPEVEAEVIIERMAPATGSVITDGPRRLDSLQVERHRQQSQQQQ